MDKYQEGMIPLTDHEKTIKELSEKWAEELMFQKLQWEGIHKELKELKKFQIYVGGEGTTIYSFPRIVKHQSAISLLPCVFV